MATLYVRDVPDRLYQQARKVAAEQGRSLNAYVVGALQQALKDEKARRAASKTLAAIRRRRASLPRDAPDSVNMLRQIRGRHGG